MEKCVGCFLLYLFLEDFFFIKKCEKKICMCVGVTSHIATYEKFIFCCEKRYE